MSFSEDEKHKEATRLLETPDLIQKAESHSIIRFLEEIRRGDQPSKHCSEKELVAGLHGPGRVKIKDGYIRANVRRARTFLDEHYRLLETNYGQICLVLARDASKGKRGYYIDFEAYPGPYTGLPLGVVERFWKQQIAARVLANAARPDTAAQVKVVFSDETAPGMVPDVGSVVGIWSGTGEVVGCYYLGKVFDKTDLDADIIRSSTLGNESTHKNRVFVYVGSSLAMKALEEERERGRLKAKQRFFFKFGKESNGHKRGEIVDIAPDFGDRSVYFCETVTEWMFHDYALISYFYDQRLNQAIVGLAGISTYGTEHAVRFVTEPELLSDLFERIRLETGSEKPLPEFEALVRVEVSRGQPTDGDIIAFSTPKKLLARRADKQPLS